MSYVFLRIYSNLCVHFVEHLVFEAVGGLRLIMLERELTTTRNDIFAVESVPARRGLLAKGLEN